MKLTHKVITIISLFTLSMIACKNQQETETEKSFELSDTMLSICGFEKAKFDTVKNELRLFGKVTADNNKMAQVYPIVSGVVKSINVELGDYVTQGQILASIQSSEVAEFQKEKLDAINELAIAEKNLQVAKDLYAGKLTSEKDVAAAEKEVEKAKAELNRINEIYKIYNLKDGSIYQITAPISGFIVHKNINQNEQIRSDISEPLFSIAEINEVWILANVNESDISKVKVGYDAYIKTLAFQDTIYTGKIDKIFNAIDPETKSMKVRIKIANKDLKLKPEMNCTVSIKYAEDYKLIAVPSSSVIFDKSKYWVMVFKDKSNIETRRVEVYRQLRDVTYIKSGIDENETVITQNALLVYDALND
jgi:cobalt-zinc-cadmium efflux system membrane fusion protein